MTVVLESRLGGRWVRGEGPGTELVDPTTGETVAEASSRGLDLGAALAFARDVGGPALRELTFAQRAGMIGEAADVLAANRAEYVAIAQANSGNTEADAAVDIDGAIGTLKYYARLGAGLGDARTVRDGGPLRLAKDPGFQAQHLMVPIRGVAVHVNAFNFPAWGLWEKAAVALLAGVPAFAKPATATCWLSERMVRDVVAAGVLPEGALSILCGSPGDLLDHLTEADAVAFTGSADTARAIRLHPSVAGRSVRLNVEADSLNACILGPDAGPGSPEFDLFVREVAREMTQKAGQKCTAIRRALVPAEVADAAAEAVAARLAGAKWGNPRAEGVRMGPVVSASQRDAVLATVAELKAEADVVFDGAATGPVEADPARGAFVPPTWLRARDPDGAEAVHRAEPFGPVATLVPYRDRAHAWALARRGAGSLVASVFSADPDFRTRTALEIGDMHGRVLMVDASVARASTGHGIVMPMCQHGGPGRAGGGSELGGPRGLAFYLQRVAVQGPAADLDALASAAVPLDG
jgi:3,4-dehydroadipyl-CoA semialdehyde dehydrogenase